MKELKPKLKALSIYQIAGGVIGLALTAWIFAEYIDSMTGLLLTLFSIAIVLYVYSVYCGILLLKNHVLGLKYSLINQVLQVLSFSALGFAFQFVAGGYIYVGVDLTEGFLLKLNAGISTWQIIVNDDEQMLSANINLVALYLIIFIEKIKRRSNDIEVENQLSDIITTE